MTLRWRKRLDEITEQALVDEFRRNSRPGCKARSFFAPSNGQRSSSRFPGVMDPLPACSSSADRQVVSARERLNRSPAPGTDRRIASSESPEGGRCPLAAIRHCPARGSAAPKVSSNRRGPPTALTCRFIPSAGNSFRRNVGIHAPNQPLYIHRPPCAHCFTKAQARSEGHPQKDAICCCGK